MLRGQSLNLAKLFCLFLVPCTILVADTNQNHGYLQNSEHNIPSWITQIARVVHDEPTKAEQDFISYVHMSVFYCLR
jgi:hypothetical protein